MINLSMKKSIKLRITVLFLIIVLVLTLLLIAILYNQTSSMLLRETAIRAYSTAEQASKLIDVNEFVKLETMEDENTPSYTKMRDDLIKIRELSGAKYVYTMRKTDQGDFMYVIDGSTDEDFSHIGDTEESIPEYEQTWSGEAFTDSEIFEDEKWGSLISTYFPIKNDAGAVVGFVGVDYSVELAQEGLTTFQRTCNIIIGLLVVIIFVSGLLLSSSITKPIKNAADFSKQLASLNLGIEVSEKDLTRKDELGDLAQSLNSIKESLRRVITQIKESFEQLAATSQEMTASSQESSSAIEEVSRAVDEIAKGASEQAQNTETGASKAVLLGNIIDKDIEQTNNINQAVVNVTEFVREGLAEIERLTKINDENNIANKTINDIIIKTYESAQKINQASSIIASIAEQTNMLSLNAAIEAARAGESGRGFAVVADQIKKLAEQSTDSIKTIDQIVEELQMNSQDAVNTMERISQITVEQTESVIKNSEKYKLIDEAMKGSQRAISELNLAGQEMVEMKNVILNTLDSLSAIAEENSASTEEVTSSTVQQVASIKELTLASENLSQLAQDMQSTVAKFKM